MDNAGNYSNSSSISSSANPARSSYDVIVIDETSLNLDHSESTFDGYNASLGLLQIAKRN